MPDRMVIFPNSKPIFVELKTDKGSLSALQKVRISELKKLGQITYVTYGMHGIIDFFKDYGFSQIAANLENRYLQGEAI